MEIDEISVVAKRHVLNKRGQEGRERRKSLRGANLRWLSERLPFVVALALVAGLYWWTKPGGPASNYVELWPPLNKFVLIFGVILLIAITARWLCNEEDTTNKDGGSCPPEALSVGDCVAEYLRDLVSSTRERELGEGSAFRKTLAEVERVHARALEILRYFERRSEQGGPDITGTCLEQARQSVTRLSRARSELEEFRTQTNTYLDEVLASVSGLSASFRDLDMITELGRIGEATDRLEQDVRALIAEAVERMQLNLQSVKEQVYAKLEAARAAALLEGPADQVPFLLTLEVNSAEKQVRSA
ncbi:MAG: hypothetical protein UY92_C0010G0030 [Candidatus Magasanikbacteria bacterium GW2011_GWA2_56_11]|uniref:Uncharacterized protein n=1 Tax=Candidatus Magasanikbacteria bacterium GW2011_GWA2_56_11 TaxID=1619044 RepID=A0A0G2B9J6_9BACT|nr:MAG: hypothetical protein UY92_C0010G0030 [Candidatus Magasanikbacteria bacterium GW2011_GWA2_56_11]